MELVILIIIFLILYSTGILSLLWKLIVTVGVIAFVVLIGRVYVDSTQTLVIFIVGIIAVIGIMYIIGSLSDVFTSVSSDKSSTRKRRTEKNDEEEMDSTMRHKKDSHESISRSCENCKYYDSRFGNCDFDTKNNISGIRDARDYICDYFRAK